jgi:hypothetical protein
MAEVELNLEDLTVPELIFAGTRLAEGLTKNDNFPDALPHAAELQELAQKLVAAQEEYRAQRHRLIQLNNTRDAIADDLKAALARGATYVQNASDGDAEKILSANLHFEHGFRLWPFGSLDQVVDVLSTAGDEPGEIDVAWDPVRSAAGYEIELSRDVGPYGPWEEAAATQKSKISLQNLTSRQRYWIRVRAVSENKTGEWSEPVSKTAP